MDATLMNGATCSPGEGVVFDGVDDYVDLVGQSLGGPMTIAFWARWDALNSMVALCEFADGQYNDNISIGNCRWDGISINLIRYHYVGSSESGHCISEGTIVRAWTHVVGTVQGTTMKLYQDGVVVSTVDDGHEPS